MLPDCSREILRGTAEFGVVNNNLLTLDSQLQLGSIGREYPVFPIPHVDGLQCVFHLALVGEHLKVSSALDYEEGAVHI